MSLRPVLGRSSAFASVWTRRLYSGSICISTIARPPLSLTSPMSPMRTPETWIVWPWPAVTAWPVANSAYSVNGFFSISGKRSRSWSRM